jgi:hypothetical protein
MPKFIRKAKYKTATSNHFCNIKTFTAKQILIIRYLFESKFNKSGYIKGAQNVQNIFGYFPKIMFGP